MTDTIEPARRPSRLPATVRALRPKQWVKNVLVFAAPVAAGSLFQPKVLAASALAFVAFCLVSSSVYLLNDARDVEQDRLHPKKRFRPIAAGELSVPAALLWGGVLLAFGLGLGFWVTTGLGAVLATYWLLQVGYTLFAKHEPIFDLAMVAAGFLLRAVAGGVASGIPVSQWFLLVASFGSLFMVAGKRYSEMVQLGADVGTRASLERYTPTYLRFVWTLSAGAVILSYSLWAFTLPSSSGHWLGVPWAQVSIAPFTLAMLRYAYVIDAGDAGEPEDVVMADHTLQVLGIVWLVPVALMFVR